MNKAEFEEILYENEDFWLDWKVDFPQGLLLPSGNPKWEIGKAKLIKSLVAIAVSKETE